MTQLAALLVRLRGWRSCREVVSTLGDYCDRQLDPRLDRATDRHLGVCPDCRALARGYREVIELTGELRCDEIPGELRDRVRRVLSERIAGRRG